MVFLFAAMATGAESPQPCKVLLQAKLAGEAVFSDEVTPASCLTKQGEARLRYDPLRRIVIARESMSPGTPLGLVYVPRRPAVAAGDVVRIDVTVGQVSVARAATALEPAEFGQRFHVRTSDGLVLRAPAMIAPQAADRRNQ